MQLKGLSMSFGVQEIFKNININIPDNEKVGIVGANGVGKTTLLKVMMNLIEPDQGEVIIKNNARINWLPQVINDEVPNMDITVLDYLLTGRPIEKLNQKLQELYEKLSHPSADTNLIFTKIDKVEKELDYWDSYGAESTLLKITAGLKLDDEFLLKKLGELSGGQKSKVAFARLLYTAPEIILLDEPTNHLDQDSKEYIINYLKHYKGTVLIISHDIDFLNQVTTKTLFMDKRTKNMTLYDGNYEYFLKTQSAHEQALLNQLEIQNKEEKRLREIVLKYSNSSGNRKRMAQDREKKLAKLLSEKITIVEPNKSIKLTVEMDKQGANLPLEVRNLTFRYNQELNINILEKLSFDIYRGEKFLVVGENGAGKSTLLKLIVGILKPLEGSIYLGKDVKIGYYAQELEALDKTKTILDNFSDMDLSMKRLRSVLGRFLFFGDDVYKNVGILSPGERSRVALAKLSISGANFLVLDEPTNHLDPQTQKLIAEVFKTFKGTMLLVSHNPDFVDDLGIERVLILPTCEITYYHRQIILHYQNLNTKLKK